MSRVPSGVAPARTWLLQEGHERAGDRRWRFEHGYLGISLGTVAHPPRVLRAQTGRAVVYFTVFIEIRLRNEATPGSSPSFLVKNCW
jgi:hypothetical protein